MKFKVKSGPLLLCVALSGFPVFTALGGPAVHIGNAIVRPETLEKIIRMTIAEAMNGELNENRLSLISETRAQQIIVPAAKPALKQILDLLGIKNHVAIEIAPIHAKFILPQDDLRIEIKNPSSNSFLIHARWSATQLNAHADRVSIKVPAGFFPQSFSINSSPVAISMTAHSAPVQFDTIFKADLSEAGTKLHLLKFNTNLEASAHPDFAITLGKLTVDGKPLTLEIQSNGQRITASEQAIRAEFQSFESGIAQTIRKQLVTLIEKQTFLQTKRLEAQDPSKYSANSDEWLAKLHAPENLKALLGGMDFEFLLSNLQSMKSVDAYSAQIAAKICFDGHCLADLGPVSPVSSVDLEVLQKQDDVGAVVYESMLQSIVHSPEFQTRIKNFYIASGTSPGVDLASSGARIYLDPALDGFIAVINLEIDIKKTIKESSPFGQRIKTRFGDLWEEWFGSGKFVRIPIEVAFRIIGIEKDLNGSPILMITTELPFRADGTLASSGRCPPTLCQSNVEQMTQLVKKGFLASLKHEIELLVPPVITIPIGTALQIKSFQVALQNIQITEHHGLLITAGVHRQSGRLPHD